MPHFGNEVAVHTMGKSGDAVASSSDTRGADLLLSLAERASEHVKTLDTPSGKEFYPLTKTVTPGQGELDQNGRGPMLMSIHSNANHRILPSPIKLQGYSLVYSSTSSESSSPPTLEKREADSPPSDSERPLKQPRTEEEEHHDREAHRAPDGEDANERDNESASSTLISPASSNEGKKAEVKSIRPTPGAPPHSYYVHHSAPTHLQQHYSYPHPQYHPSWGHPHAPPPPHPPHMASPYYYPPHQYYSMMPRNPASYPPHMPPHSHHPHSTPKKPTPAPSSHMSREGAGGKETPMSSKHAEAQAEAIKSISDWQKGINGTPRTYARCIPLQHPIPSRYWGETNKDVDRKLPDFPRLVNFPDYLSRGQTRNGGDCSGSTAEGKRHCVMCGQLRICSKSATRANQKVGTPVKAADADSTVHIIPRQNKGVCTACDVAVWVMVSQDGLEIKWCKGCKNFRPWAAFGEKGLATKCVRCRHRQREKYASQKNEMRRQQESYLEKKEDDILAAQGLSNLMSAQTQNS